MERILNQEERIRRAEEIYARRQMVRDRTRSATVNVSSNAQRKNFRLFKRIALQMVICLLIYFIFYLINTTNYTFSEQTLNKTDELLSEDVDFIYICKNIIDKLNGYINSINGQDKIEPNENEITEESNENIEGENQVQENSEDSENSINIENNENLTGMVDTNLDESTGQEKLEDVNISETDRIKNTYSFVKPVSGYITSEFGTREATSSIVSTYHKGIDIAANLGTPIVAATNGTVIISKLSQSYGNYIMLENGEVKTVYAHCSKLLVKERGYSNSRTRNCKSR